MIPRALVLPFALLAGTTAWTAAAATAEIALDPYPMAAVSSRDGKHALVLQAGTQPPSILVFDTTTWQEVSRTAVPDAWLGLTFSRDGKFVYAGGGASAAVYEFAFADGKLTPARTFPVAPPATRASEDFIGDVQFSPDGRLLYAADLYRNAIAVINPQSGRVIERFPTGRRPYQIVFHPDGKSYFVSSWADGTVYHHRAIDGERLGFIRLGPHTTAMTLSSKPVKTDEDDEKPNWKHRLFVAAANTNQVYVVGITENQEMRLVESISVAIEAGQPAGMTPSSLALSPDEKELYVVCSDANAAAVVNIETPKSVLRGFAPSGGLYPLAALPLPGNRMLLLNSNPGTAHLVDLSSADAFRKLSLNRPATPPSKADIAHVVYVVVDRSGPVLEKATREFVNFPNFRMAGTSLPSRLHWAVAGISPDYIEKMAPATIAGRRPRNDLEGGEPAALPPANYLWTNALAKGITVRNHGFWVENQKVKDPGLARVTPLPGLFSPKDLPALTLVRLRQDSELGPVLDTLRASPQWPRMAIFVLSLDGRATVVSPFVKQGFTDPTPYDQTSVLRTIEGVLGLQPMTVFDATATPIELGGE
jgi:YVTN family beta-propeller protein